MTYDYSEATVVLGPLAARREPNAYDLCQQHAASLTAPQGWQVIRLAVSEGPADPDDEDLEVLANLVRKVSGQGRNASARIQAAHTGRTSRDREALERSGSASPSGGDRWWGPEVTRYGHLRVISGAGSQSANAPSGEAGVTEALTESED